MIPLSYVCAKILRRFGLRATILTGALLCIPPCILTPNASIPGHFALQLLLGIGCALSYNVCLSACLDPFDPTLHSSVMGLVQTVYGLGVFIGPPLTAALIGVLGFERALCLVALSAVAAAGLALFLPKRQLAPPLSQPSQSLPVS